MPLVVAGGTVYITCEAGLVAVDGGSGVIVAESDQPDLFGGMAVSGSRLYGTDRKAVYAFGPG